MIKAILIDDEVHCLDTLNILLTDYCPEVNVMEICPSPKKGLEAIEKLKPELVFLDIEMPLMNGFELLQQFKEIPFFVIFTTSYDQYAIKAIRFSALDYLLKPIDPKELIAAVHKIQTQKAPPGIEQFRILLEQLQGKENNAEKISAILNKNFSLSSNNSPRHRHLAAILFTDIVGYTAAMGQNEVKAINIIKRYTFVLKQTVASHSGEILNDYGDGSLCIFSSATEAVKCAIEIQKQLQTEPVVALRIGMHIGEVLFEEGKIFGDGVNLASRIQSLGQANTILFSEEIHNKIKNNPEFKSALLGSFEFKNVEKPVEVFVLTNEGLSIPSPDKMEGKLKKEDSGRIKHFQENVEEPGKPKTC